MGCQNGIQSLIVLLFLKPTTTYIGMFSRKQSNVMEVCPERKSPRGSSRSRSWLETDKPLTDVLDRGRSFMLALVEVRSSDSLAATLRAHFPSIPISPLLNPSRMPFEIERVHIGSPASDQHSALLGAVRVDQRWPCVSCVRCKSSNGAAKLVKVHRVDPSSAVTIAIDLYDPPDLLESPKITTTLLYTL